MGGLLRAGLGDPADGISHVEDGADVRLSFVPAGVACNDAGGGYAPTLAAGEEFSVCATVTVRIPLLTDFVDANTATGQFVIETDRYADR